jgi:hypothetical protein
MVQYNQWVSFDIMPASKRYINNVNMKYYYFSKNSTWHPDLAILNFSACLGTFDNNVHLRHHNTITCVNINVTHILNHFRNIIPWCRRRDINIWRRGCVLNTTLHWFTCETVTKFQDAGSVGHQKCILTRLKNGLDCECERNASLQ